MFGKRTIMVAGGFDPFHTGHLSLLQKSKDLGGELIVVVESDEWLESVKHPTMLNQTQRAKVIGALKMVDTVVLGEGIDGCSHLVRSMRPDLFVVGRDHSDYTLIPEYQACCDAGTEIVCIDSEDDTHSSEVVASLAKRFHSRNVPVTGSVIIQTERGVLLGTRGDGDSTTGQLALIGGFVEPGETLEQTTRREVREETNIELRFLDYLFSHAGSYHDGRTILSVYFTSRTSQEPQPSDEMTAFTYVNEPVETAFESDTIALQRYFQHA